MTAKRSTPKLEKRPCSVCQGLFRPRTPQHIMCSERCRRDAARAKLVPTAATDNALLGEAAECFVAADLMRRNVIVFRNVARTGPADMVAWSPDRRSLALVDVKGLTTAYRRVDGSIRYSASAADGVHLAFVVGESVFYAEGLRHALGIPDLPLIPA